MVALSRPAGRSVRVGSQRVAAVYPKREDRKISRILPHWNSYVAVIHVSAPKFLEHSPAERLVLPFLQNRSA